MDEFENFTYVAVAPLRRLAYAQTGRWDRGDAAVCVAFRSLARQWRHLESGDPYAVAREHLEHRLLALRDRTRRTRPTPRGALLATLQSLPPRTRAVVVLRCYEGLTSDQVCAAVDSPRWSVDRRWARARERLGDDPAARLREEVDSAWEAAPPPPQPWRLGVDSARQRNRSVSVTAAAGVICLVVVPGLVREVADSMPSGFDPHPHDRTRLSADTLYSNPICSTRPPRQLPNGRATGRVRAGPRTGTFAWGAGANRVVQALGEDRLDLIGSEAPGRRRVDTGSVEAWLTRVDDLGQVQVAAAFRAGECAYTVWLPPGLSLDRAATYLRTAF